MKDINLDIEQLLRYFFSGVVALASWHIAYKQTFRLGQQDVGTSLTLGVTLALVIGTLIYAIHRALIFPLIHRILLLRFWETTSEPSDCWISGREHNFYVRYWQLRDTRDYADRPMHEWAATIHFLYCSGWGILAVIFLGYLQDPPLHNCCLWGIFGILIALAILHNCRFIVALKRLTPDRQSKS